MTGGELGEIDDDDQAILLALEIGGIAPHTIADWPHAWRLRTENVIGGKKRAKRKHDEQRKNQK